jgi:deoxyribose-phosphate aldolase
MIRAPAEAERSTRTATAGKREQISETEKPIEQNTDVTRMEAKELAAYIDHTLLKADSTVERIKNVCHEAREYHFAAACVPPCYVTQARQWLEGSKVKLATVIGFPLGYSHSLIKVEEAKRAMEDGADELDVVMNLAAFFSGNDKEVIKEIQSITQLAHLKGKVVKWIIETGLLAPNDIRRACAMAVKAEVDYVKTSTGFNGDGATIEAVELLHSLLPKNIRIKASGGIKTRQQAEAFISAGASRIGTSSSIQIVSEQVPTV